MSSGKRCVVFLFSLLIHAFSASAEDLELINVTSQKDVNFFTFGRTLHVPTAQLEKNPSSLLFASLESNEALVSNQNGGPGGRVSFFLRGTESRHVSFTLDGLKINDPSNTDRQFDSAFLTSPFIKDAKIHLGPQSVLFGSDAIGGTVELQTRKGEKPGETRFVLNAGSFGTLDSSLSTDWKKSSNRGSLTYTQFHTDGISRLNKKRFNATERDSADITQITSSSSHSWNNIYQTDFLFSYLHGKNEFDPMGLDSSYDHSSNDQYVFQQKTFYEVSEQASLSLRNGFNRHQRFIDSSGVGEETYNGSLLQNELLLRQSFDQGEVLTGLSVEQERSDSAAIDRTFDLQSGFIQTSLGKEVLTLQSGGRVDRHSRYGWFPVGSSGLAYKKNNNSFAVQFSQGYKAPSLYQLYGPPIFGFPLGNKNLKPERNNSWDLSWMKKYGGFTGKVVLFHNRLSNLITFSNLGYRNQGKFTALGTETSFKWSFELFEVAAGFTHQKFAEELTPVLRRPQNFGQLALAWFHNESLESFFKYRFFDSRDDVDLTGQRVKLNGYETVEIGLKKNFEKNDVGVQILNLFDRKYEELYGYNVLPRSVFFHYGHRFN